MKKTFLSGLLLVVSFFLISTTTASAEVKEYVNGVDANFPPFTFLNSRGILDGFDIKAINWIAKEMGFAVKHRPIDWEGRPPFWSDIIDLLKNRKIDLIASGMSITEERKNEVSFTMPYWSVKYVLVVRKTSRVTLRTALAANRRIGVLRGTSEAKWLDENVLKKQHRKVSILGYDSPSAALEDLLSGKLDAVAINDTYAKQVISKVPVKNIGHFGMPEEQFAYAVRKDDTELLQLLNEGLKRLQASPSWKELQEQYMK